jgi:hypothetical protein
MPESIKKRVARGAALLDEKSPGWHLKIYPSVLKMSSCFNCVLGQACGGFGPEAFDGLGIEYPEDAVPYGFDFDPKSNNSYHEYTALREAWIREVERRREKTSNA